MSLFTDTPVMFYYWWVRMVGAGRALLIFAVLLLPSLTSMVSAVALSPRTVTVWVQATDSCEEALPGAFFVVAGPGLVRSSFGPTRGSHLAGLSTYRQHCPVDRGRCGPTLVGCASVVLPVPAVGTAKYTITPKVIAGSHYLSGIVVLPAKPFGRNYAYVQCEGGSDCRFGPEVATVLVTSNGSVSATTQNVNPDGFKDHPWPSAGAFLGQASDPVLFHLFGASAPHDFAMTCGNLGGHGLKDHLTGTPYWAHCNSGR